MGRPDLFVDGLSHLILPAIALGSIPLAIITRITRASVLDVTNEDYVRTARAKGIGERRISTSYHAQRLAAGRHRPRPAGRRPSGRSGHHRDDLRLGWGRAVRRRWIFNRDYLVIQNTILIFAVVFLVVNLLVDILYAVPQSADPVRLMAAPASRRAGRRRAPRQPRPVGRRLPPARCATARRCWACSSSPSSCWRRSSPRSSRPTGRSRAGSPIV